MAIQYPVDVINTRWATLQLSTGEIVARNRPWPTGDGSEIPNLDPDYVMLLHLEDTRPNYDSRLYSLQGTETVDADANELRKTWETIKRPLEEIKVAAQNVEVQELQKHINLEREIIETRLMVAAILQFLDGLQLPPRIQNFADNYKAKGVKLWRNRDRLRAILADIENGLEPDLDAGWEAPDA